LQACDLFAFPSRNEPDHQEHDGHALMEAMAVGLASVATRSGIIGELTDSEATHFVRESVHGDLVAALRDVVVHPERRAAMGRRARALAELRFGLESLARRRRRIYEDVRHG
jgi:glycosyltransferase involved in cell wall biosynthesis